MSNPFRLERLARRVYSENPVQKPRVKKPERRVAGSGKWKNLENVEAVGRVSRTRGTIERDVRRATTANL